MLTPMGLPMGTSSTCLAPVRPRPIRCPGASCRAARAPGPPPARARPPQWLWQQAMRCGASIPRRTTPMRPGLWWPPWRCPPAALQHPSPSWRRLWCDPMPGGECCSCDYGANPDSCDIRSFRPTRDSTAGRRRGWSAFARRRRLRQREQQRWRSLSRWSAQPRAAFCCGRRAPHRCRCPGSPCKYDAQSTLMRRTAVLLG